MHYQDSFLGKSILGKSVKERVRYILERCPWTRNSYKALMLAYWKEFDGLTNQIASDGESFERWFISSATSPKTIQNRAMEIQRENKNLDADENVRAWRNNQARAGIVV